MASTSRGPSSVGRRRTPITAPAVARPMIAIPTSGWSPNSSWVDRISGNSLSRLSMNAEELPLSGSSAVGSSSWNNVVATAKERYGVIRACQVGPDPVGDRARSDAARRSM